jgi:hypothetical protein
MQQQISRREALAGIGLAGATGMLPVAAAAFHAGSNTSAWDEAFADYQAKRAFSDAMPLGTPNEDDAVDAYCRAMDHLIEEVPAPHTEALAIKIELAMERYERSCMPDEVLAAWLADARALAVRGL